MKTHHIIIYRFTGRQGFFYVPKKWCKECDLLVAIVEETLAKHGLKDRVSLSIRPWWLLWFIPLVRYGNLTAPQLIIDGALISSGEQLPTEQDIVNALGVKHDTSA